MNPARSRNEIGFRSAGALKIVAVGLVVVALTAGCREEPSLPTTAQDVNRVMMEPDSELKVRRLLELAAQSRKDLDLPSMRSTLTAAMQTALTLEDPVVRADLLTVISADYVKEGWEKESRKAISGARIAAATIHDVSKKVGALTNLAVALRQAGDGPSADSAILDAEKTIAGVAEPELRVPLLAALSTACARFGDPKKAETHLKASKALAVTITDPHKRALAETHAALACFKWERQAEGRTFYDSAVASAEKIEDPAVKTETLLDLVDILHPYRKFLPIEQPLQTAITTAATITDAAAKEKLEKRANALPKPPMKEKPPASVP